MILMLSLNSGPEEVEVCLRELKRTGRRLPWN